MKVDKEKWDEKKLLTKEWCLDEMIFHREHVHCKYLS